MYFEAQVIFTEEIPTKNGVKEKKTRKAFLVECDSVSVAEAKVNEYLKEKDNTLRAILAHPEYGTEATATFLASGI